MATTTSVLAEGDTTRDLAESTASALGRPYEDGRSYDKQPEQAAKVDETEVEYGSSRPPSPPSTGTTTPTLTIAPCPSRLWTFVPPPQYGVVEDYTIFRSSYPQDRNMDFIRSLEIRSILTLVETDPTPGFTAWLDDFQIKQGKVTITPNKEAKEDKKASATSLDSICEALLFAMDGVNHPLWIHCNQGRHRTGCVVACLRKIKGMPIGEIIQEYVAYASPKARPGDIAFIKAFEPSAVFDYATKTGLIGGAESKLKSIGPTPITNIYELAHELACRGRQDSVAPSDMETAVDNLSSGMSEASLGEPAEPTSNMVMSQALANETCTGAIEQTNSIDPRLLSSGDDTRGCHPMVVEVVEVGDDRVDNVETLALHGGLDPMMDPETVASALA